MSDIERAINLSNELYDLILSITNGTEDTMERIGKHHPQYNSISWNHELLLGISELLEDVDLKLHDLDREEELL